MKRCRCATCAGGGLGQIGNAFQLRDQVLCDKEAGSALRGLECINSECEHCGIRKFCDEQLCNAYGAPGASCAGDVKVKLEEYKSVEYPAPGGTMTRAKTFVECTMGLSALWGKLSTGFEIWLKHYDHAQYHALDDHALQAGVRPHGTLVIEDFAENYTIRKPKGGQPAYWRQKQVTIFPAVMYVHVDSCKFLPAQGGAGVKDLFWRRQHDHNGGGAVNPVIALSHIFVSRGVTHDTFAVQHFNKLLNEWAGGHLHCEGAGKFSAGSCSCGNDDPPCRVVHEWPCSPPPFRNRSQQSTTVTGCERTGDGSRHSHRAQRYYSDNASHFKNSANMAFFAPRQGSQQRPRCVWNFHGAMHGKCLCDAGGGRAKHFLDEWPLRVLGDQDVAGAQNLRTAEDCANALRAGFNAPRHGYAAGKGVPRRFVHYVDDAPRDARSADTLHGINRQHQLIDIGVPNSLWIREYACNSCPRCIIGDFEGCEGPSGRAKAPVGATVAIKTGAARRLTQLQMGRHGSLLANQARVGQHAALSARGLGLPENYVVGCVTRALEWAITDMKCPLTGNDIKHEAQIICVDALPVQDGSTKTHTTAGASAAIFEGSRVLMLLTPTAAATGTVVLSHTEHHAILQLSSAPAGAGAADADPVLEEIDAAAQGRAGEDNHAEQNPEPGVCRVAPRMSARCRGGTRVLSEDGTDLEQRSLSTVQGGAFSSYDGAAAGATPSAALATGGNSGGDDLDGGSASLDTRTGEYAIARLLERRKVQMKKGGVRPKRVAVQWGVRWSGYGPV